MAKSSAAGRISAVGVVAAALGLLLALAGVFVTDDGTRQTLLSFGFTIAVLGALIAVGGLTFWLIRRS